MSHDPKNPISNETGEYLQELVEAPKESDSDRMPAPAVEKPKPAKRTNKR
jgi:hypothetical protein